MEDKDKIRIAKRMSDLGYCSRREAERLIKANKVKVNGVVVESPAFFVSDADIINVDDKVLEVLRNKEIGLFALNKPLGYITTRSDEKNRPIVYDLVPPEVQKNEGNLIYIGRLDINSEGLLLFTNNGEFARFLTLPSSRVVRRYKVRAHGFLDQKKFKRMQNGVFISGESFLPLSLSVQGKVTEDGSFANIWFDIELTTGKNNELRRFFEHFGFQVSRLMRTHYAGIGVDDMPKGAFAKIIGKPLEHLIRRFNDVYKKGL